jgi:ABC-type glycerol-3-phosphate transport system substrate-binding protein
MHLSLVLTLAFAVSAKAQSVDWKTELKKADGKTLRIIMIQDPWVKAFDTIDQEFQQLTGAQVVVDSFSYDDVHQKEVLAGNNKSDSYDVVVLDSPWVGEFQQGGYVEDLKPSWPKTPRSSPGTTLFLPFKRSQRGKASMSGFRSAPIL